MKIFIKKKYFLVFSPLISFFVLICIIDYSLGAQNIQENKSGKYAIGSLYDKKMRFQKIWKDYVIFYDSENQLYYLRFRQDRWDYTNIEKVKDFSESMEYIISFTFSGDSIEDDFIEKESQRIKFSAPSRSRRYITKIYFGEYKKHRNPQIEMIRF